ACSAGIPGAGGAGSACARRAAIGTSRTRGKRSDSRPAHSRRRSELAGPARGAVSVTQTGTAGSRCASCRQLRIQELRKTKPATRHALSEGLEAGRPAHRGAFLFRGASRGGGRERKAAATGGG